LATYGSLRRACARFDRFQVDLSSNELLCSGARVPIQEQPLQVLRLLLEADGKVVTREQLRSALWPENTFVDFEHGVNTAVKKLRQALEDSAENPKFVETLPKLGYRFIRPVEWVPDATHKLAQPHIVPIALPGPVAVPRADVPQRSWKMKAVIAGTALGLLTTVGLLVSENGRLSHTRWGTWVRQLTFGHGPEPRAALDQRRLTANTDDAPVTGGVISPDGKYLAYTDADRFLLATGGWGRNSSLAASERFRCAARGLVPGQRPSCGHLVWIPEGCAGRGRAKDRAAEFVEDLGPGWAPSKACRARIVCPRFPGWIEDRISDRLLG
jgi:DNA-binding winged helix-turn-helix (wHTH) protein